MGAIQTGSASGNVVTKPSVSGLAKTKGNISGSIHLGGRGVKEIRYLPIDRFPEVGSDEILYVDTTNNDIYYYDKGYIKLADADVINDSEIELALTWSSHKINQEFENDQAQLDAIGNISAITNSEIAAMLAD